MAISYTTSQDVAPAAAREPSQLSTWPDGKTITESNRVHAYLCKISALLHSHEIDGKPVKGVLKDRSVRAELEPPADDCPHR